MPINGKILVADDERLIADTLAMILNQSGFEARAVYSGEEALKLASIFPADMLVSDVIMADLNGIETAILMRSMLPRIKVLLFSGQAASAELLTQASAKGYEFEILAKPVHPKDLLEKLRNSGIDPAIPQAIQIATEQTSPQTSWIDIAPAEDPGARLPASSKEN